MNRLIDIIRHEIAERRILPFARFMELALYCPKRGYYETKKDNPGRHGDFYTSVGTGELFGQLLARQFAEWLEPLRIADCGLRIVEAGAHDGKLAGDILAWLQTNRPELFKQIEYCVIEPSLQRQAWQKETLGQFSPVVRWLPRFNSSSGQRLNGVIFSNELLDALPIHRYGWDAGKQLWFEWGVVLEGERFVWAKIPGSEAQAGSASAILHQPASLLKVLPDGYTIETGPAAEDWWRDAAEVLGRGKLMTIDYGLTADELFSPERPGGTLRAYFRHHASDDLLANVGEQDLTAHVNFSALRQIGEAAGLKTESFQSQAQFLTQILKKSLNDKSFGGLSPARTRQFQTLTHPEHLGRAFRVLVQSR